MGTPYQELHREANYEAHVQDARNQSIIIGIQGGHKYRRNFKVS